MPGPGPERADYGLSDPALWASGDEAATFARLRQEQPVSWQAEPASPGFSPGPGYWAVVRHHDVMTVSTDSRRFSSVPTTSIRDLPADLGQYFGSMLNMDDPRHAMMRRVVSHAFTKRRLQHIRESVELVAQQLVANACLVSREQGACDVIEAVAAPLPLRVICELMGIPRAEWEDIAAHGETLGLARDVESLLTAAGELHGCASRLAAHRMGVPGDDLTSVLVQANVDGEALTPTEVGSFFMLLVVAGAQTTRHAIGHGAVALAEYPDQRARLNAEPGLVGSTAVDEILRWATPVRHFRRTATEDAVLGDTAIAAGDKVVMWYTSANRDEGVFDSADHFDVTRRPNPHVSFGAGSHYCLGAGLARHEIAAVVTAMLRQCPSWSVVRADPLISSFVDGYASVECHLSAG